jgi:hypothetical protein
MFMSIFLRCLVIQAGNRDHRVSGNVQQRLPNTIVRFKPPETTQLFPDSGHLIPDWIDAVIGYSKGVLQGAFGAAVVPTLTGKKGVQLLADREVGVTIRFPWLT